MEQLTLFDPDLYLSATELMLRALRYSNSVVTPPVGGLLPSCRCAPLATCNNAACPRSTNITC